MNVEISLSASLLEISENYGILWITSTKKARQNQSTIINQSQVKEKVLKAAKKKAKERKQLGLHPRVPQLMSSDREPCELPQDPQGSYEGKAADAGWEKDMKHLRHLIKFDRCGSVFQ